MIKRRTMIRILAVMILCLGSGACRPAHHDPRHSPRADPGAEWVQCQAEDGGPQLPCRWDSRCPGGQCPGFPATVLYVSTVDQCPTVLPTGVVCTPPG